MDNRLEYVKEILLDYKDITNVEIESKECVCFSLHSAEYALYMFDDDMFPIICILNNVENYPHYNLQKINFAGRDNQSICLFEEGTIIEYIHTPEEKIKVCIDRLIQLSSLSDKEIVSEYQKEFLVYWEKACSTKTRYSSNKYQLYLDNPDKYCWLKQKQYPYNVVRISKDDYFFNDANKGSLVDKTPVLYLPIVNDKNILPPLPDKPWGGEQINAIINSLDYQYISSDAFNEIRTTSFSHKEIILIFRLHTLFFACIVVFQNAGTYKLNIKIESKIQSVIPIVVKRCDFSYLNEQIGNEVSEKHIAVVGAGSLGSYVATELIYAGFKKISIIDDDTYRYENTFRHAIRHFSNYYSKAELLKVELQDIHPEIEITAHNEKLSESNISILKKIAPDIIIFTVGSSDVQLRLNKLLFKNKCSIPIFYVWLEADGETSHVTAVRNFNEGCFECLFTDKEGNLCANVLNATKAQPNFIRNGCGGTRVPYGNKTLLTATATLLYALHDKVSKNKTYSFYQKKIVERDFPQNKRCNCCGVYK